MVHNFILRGYLPGSQRVEDLLHHFIGDEVLRVRLFRLVSQRRLAANMAPDALNVGLGSSSIAQFRSTRGVSLLFLFDYHDC